MSVRIAVQDDDLSNQHFTAAATEVPPFWLLRSKRALAEPEAAYGPPGSTGEENISVVVAPIQAGFKLESLGTAEQAGRRFLETTVASINANREANLVSAQSRYILRAAIELLNMIADEMFSKGCHQECGTTIRENMC